jgi:hypothetical protein
MLISEYVTGACLVFDFITCYFLFSSPIYSCKRFLEVTESNYFYARMSLEHFTDFECQWHFPPPTLSRIFDNCLRNKNSDALFKKAVVCIYIHRYRKYDECYTLYNSNVIVNFLCYHWTGRLFSRERRRKCFQLSNRNFKLGTCTIFLCYGDNHVI